MGYERIVQLERTCKSYLVQLPDQFRANQKLKHTNEGIVQMSLEYWVSGINCLVRRPVAVSDHPQGLLTSSLSLLWNSFVPLWPLIGTSLCTSPPRGAAESNKVISQLLLLQTGRPLCSHLSSQGMLSSPVTSFSASSECFQGSWHHSYIVETRTAHDIQGETITMLNRVRESLLLTG